MSNLEMEGGFHHTFHDNYTKYSFPRDSPVQLLGKFCHFTHLRWEVEHTWASRLERKTLVIISSLN